MHDDFEKVKKFVIQNLGKVIVVLGKAGIK